jgi:hypothetical protein
MFGINKLAAFKAVKKMIEKHHDEILNYFREGETNAKAENMNGKNSALYSKQFWNKRQRFFPLQIKRLFCLAPQKKN